MWTVTFLLAAALFASIKLIRHIAYINARKAKGCAEPPKYPHKDPFLGLDYWRNQRDAAQKSQWLSTSKALFAKYGKTYEINNLGQRMIHTMETENIQSVWATDFNNWGLQPLREVLQFRSSTTGSPLQTATSGYTVVP